MENEVKITYKPSPLAFYGAGAAFFLYSMIFPMYSIIHYIIAGAVAFIAYFILSKVLPKEKIETVIPKEKIVTGDEAADAMLNTCLEILSEIRTISTKIEDEGMRKDIDEIASITDKIIDQLKKQPGKSRDARRFMEYYLPTLKKLLLGYDEMENLGVSGENIDEAMADVKNMLTTMKDAAAKLLDGLFLSKSLDMTSDIAVMEGMMKSKGLG